MRNSAAQMKWVKSEKTHDRDSLQTGVCCAAVLTLASH